MMKSNKDKSITGTELPPCCLVLHSPYMTDAQTHYVGAVSNPLLIQCTYAAELDSKVPAISDRYLSFTDGQISYWEPHEYSYPNYLDPALSTEWPASHHVHDLSHDHFAYDIGGKTVGTTEVDANDVGTPTYVSAPGHSHELRLASATIVVSEEVDPQFYEPLHYEVSAYYVDPERGIEAQVPAGAIVFSHENGGDRYSGWLRLDEVALKRDSREVDPQYEPKVWREEALRIVGCLPSKYRKGRRDHSHAIKEHYHSSGKASGVATRVGVDITSGNDFAPMSHEHSMSYCSVSKEPVKPAENLRRHKKMLIYMALQDGALIKKGMFIPFIPRNQNDIDRVINTGIWKLHTEQTAKDLDPVMITSLSLKDLPGYDPDKYKAHIFGKNKHTHQFSHSHTVSLSQASDDGSSAGGDPEIPVSNKNHKHTEFVISDSKQSSGAINPLRYRRTLFIEKIIET